MTRTDEEREHNRRNRRQGKKGAPSEKGVFSFPSHVHGMIERRKVLFPLRKRRRSLFVVCPVRLCGQTKRRERRREQKSRMQEALFGPAAEEDIII